MADEKNEKKIIIDEDWKEQAQKEKEKLAEQQAAEKKEKEEKQDKPPLPPADFLGLVSMIATQAFYAMGLLRTEKDKDRPTDLQAAKYNIDMLEVLEKKTEGNRSDEESQLLEGTLHQLRMAFVKLSE